MLARKGRIIPSVLLLFAVLSPLFFLGLSNHGLWRPDEPRVAEIGREMAHTGNWVVPTLNQKPFLEQPPLYYWALAGVFRVFGNASDRVARIPSAVFSLGGAIAVFFLASMVFGPRVGFLSAFVLATSYEYFQVAHRVLVDSALACFLIVGMTFFMAGYLSKGKGRRFLLYTLFYFSCGLAFFAKGFLGLAIPGLGVLTFLVFERDLKSIWNLHLWLGVLIFLAMILPWLWALWRQGGRPYLEVLLIQNNLQRFLPGGVPDHSQTFYYYLIQFPGAFLPWSLMVVPVLYGAFPKRTDLPPLSRRGLLLAKSWFFSGFLLLSMAANKRVIYLLPIAAPFAILTAYWIEATIRPKTLWAVDRIFMWLFWFFVLGAGLIAAPLYFHLSGKFAFSPLLFSGFMTGLSVASLLFLRRGRAIPFWAGTLGATLAILIFVLLVIVPLMDQHDSLVPFCQQVSRAVGSDKPLYAYRPDEALRGAVPFYTGRYVEEIRDGNDLDELLRRKDPIFIVAMDRDGEIEKEILSTDRTFLLFRQEVGGRICLLFTNKQEEPSAGQGGPEERQSTASDAKPE